MDLEKFVSDCVRTESKKETIVTNENMLMNIAKIFILSGQMLDQYKKNIFYNRDLKQDVLVDNFREITDAMTNLSYEFRTNSQIDNNDTLSINPRLFHGIVGIATESTELMEQLYNAINNKCMMDNVNILEETFDASWYIGLIHNAMNAKMQHTLECGIEKLRHRFPDKFSDENANSRDLTSEREILNKMVE